MQTERPLPGGLWPRRKRQQGNVGGELWGRDELPVLAGSRQPSGFGAVQFGLSVAFTGAVQPVDVGLVFEVPRQADHGLGGPLS